MPSAKKKKRVTAESEVERIRKELRHSRMEWLPQAWLDTGYPALNNVLGCEKGIPFGKIIQLVGMESQGKTLLALHIASAAIKSGIQVVWLDTENSFDPDWARINGVDPAHVHLVEPYVGTFGREKEPRLVSAEELCEEVSALVYKRTHEKALVVLDSIPGLLPLEELATDMEDYDMRTGMALPKFLGRLMPKWLAMCKACDAICLLVNQIRPSFAKFGSPERSPGGKGLKFFIHVQAKARRAKGGSILRAGKPIGIKGILDNKKNKSGGTERASCYYKLYFDGRAKFTLKEEDSDD